MKEYVFGRQNPKSTCGGSNCYRIPLSCVVGKTRAPLFRQSAYNRVHLFSATAILTLSVVLYTLVAMSCTNTSLLAVVGSKQELSHQGIEESTDLLEQERAALRQEFSSSCRDDGWYGCASPFMFSFID